MTYKPNMVADSAALIDAKKWGVGIITTFLGLGMFLSELHRIKDSLSELLIIGYLLLFLTTGVLVFLWIWSTKKELHLLLIWLDPERYTPPTSLKETLMIVGLGIILSILFFASRDPLHYGIVFTVYSILVTYSYFYAKTEILNAIEGSKSRLRKEMQNKELIELHKQYMKGIEVLEHYFNIRPQTPRHILIVVVCLIGLIIGIVWKQTNDELFGVIAYFIFFLIIIVSEVVIAQWRNARDKQIRPIKAEINELVRNE